MFNCSPDLNCYYKPKCNNIIIVANKIRIAIKHINEEIGDLADYFLKHPNITATL